MIRHLWRLSWNRRWGYALLGLEMLVAFLMIWGIAVQAIGRMSAFRPSPGFDCRDVWWVFLERGDAWYHPLSDADLLTMGEVSRILDGFEEVEEVAMDSSPPFSPGTFIEMKKDGKKVGYQYSVVTDQLDEVLRLNLVAGRWFSAGDESLAWNPVVINQKAARTFFGDADPLGRVLPGSFDRRVIGVVDHRYDGVGGREAPFVYLRPRWTTKKSLAEVPTRFLLRLRPGTPRSFEKRLRKALRPVVGFWSIEVESLEEKRDQRMEGRFKELRLNAAIAAFMLILVALGLTGVLWQNVIQRTREIGVRRAAGATRGEICVQFVGEVLVVATFAVLLGGVLIFHFALFDVVRAVRDAIPEVLAVSLLGAAAILYLLVGAAALYPGWLAARVPPAEALHYE